MIGIRSSRLYIVGALLSACATRSTDTSPPVQSGFAITLDRVPASTPPASTIFVAGNFNGWNPRDTSYRLKEARRGNYRVTLPDSIRGPVEFKFTLGSWEAVETDSTGGDVQNRSAIVSAAGGRVYTGQVAAWRDQEIMRVREHTARPTVSIMTTDFKMPQLGRTRRVWIYLPPDYSLASGRYPVLYMHDGQNVFDNATAFAGEWGVDETLDSLQTIGERGVIVVAVDHGGDKRLDEYSPWKNAKHGGGDGEKYVDFLVKDLKPYIDSRYRTLPDRMNTGIVGSSMGGLISLYAILKYPDVFSRAGIFSPALWFAPAVYSYVREAGPVRSDVRLYFVSGALESASGEQSGVYVKGQGRMIDSLVAAGLRRDVNVLSLISPDGKHSEWFWRREFPAALKWLFGR